MPTFAERLRELRTQKDITQNSLADRIGVNKQTISQYERGVREPNFETLEALCDYFNVSTDYILGKEDVTLRLVDSAGLRRLDSKEVRPYYLDPESAEIAQAVFDNPCLHALMKAAKDCDAEQLQTVTALINQFKETNRDG